MRRGRVAGEGESGATTPPSPAGCDLRWTEEVGVCLESDICEERFLELMKLLTKLPRRRAGGGKWGGVQVRVWEGGVKVKGEKAQMHRWVVWSKRRRNQNKQKGN